MYADQSGKVAPEIPLHTKCIVLGIQAKVL